MLILLIIAPIFSIVFYQFQVGIISVNDEKNKLNLSDTIQITSPENITYTQPMSGYYPAAYGFENDLKGTNPKNWGTNEDVNTVIQVEDEFNGHKKVLSFRDQSSGGNCESWRDVGAQTSGYVEYWVAVDGTSTIKMVTLTLRDGGVYGTVAFGLTVRTDYINPWNNLDHVCDLVAQQWVHIRLEFDCDGDQGSIYVNGVYNNTYPFVNNVNTIDCLRIETSWGDLSTEKVYFDAFGASWDIDYIQGDNINEGLLLSFESSTVLDRIGYSLDGQANRTILGNHVFPYPSIGSHNIQVFGNDTLGMTYSSEKQSFSVEYCPIRIITPENTTYAQPMSGYYPATNGFESDKDGELPRQWNEIKGDSNMVNEIFSELGTHKNVLGMYKSTAYDPYVTNNNMFQFFTQPQEFGTIEFWVRTDDVNKESSWHIKGGTYDQYKIGGVGIIDGSFQVYTSALWSPVAFTASNNQWYHVRIQFECGTGNHYGLSQYQWKFFVNGFEFGWYPFVSNPSAASHIHIHQNWRYTNYNTYTDAVAYSWDPNYDIGDNLNEGLLLSFTNDTNLDWIGYSLDGQEPVTINGNHSIPFTNNGIHNIKISCNDTLGVDYETNKIYFSTQVADPLIIINNPLPNHYFGVTAPNYNLYIQGYTIKHMWYQFNDSAHYISFFTSTGTISQTEWNGLPHGFVTLNFYVNDSSNQIGHSHVSIYKDVLPPSTFIHYTPISQPNGIDGSTIFLFSASDGGDSGISSIQYRIDYGSWITYTGPFTLPNLNAGSHTINYQAIDMVGNVEDEKSITVEMVSTFDFSAIIPIMFALIIAACGALYAAIIIVKTRPRY